MDSYCMEVREEKTTSSLFSKDFILLVIGQIISLFGNQIIRYALPLYLLNETQSAALYGTVLAMSFIPMLILAPIGGIIADRVNKRNIMVGLDFATAVLVFTYAMIRGEFGLVPLLVITMMILYAIQGAYSPAVQGAIPAMVEPDNMVRANAVINSVSSISGIAGPIFGGILFSLFGLQPILIIGAVCFLVSSIMELFLVIPYEKRKSEESMLQIVKSDMKESFAFIVKEKPEIGKIVLIAAGLNLIFSSLIAVGFPVVITQHLGLSSTVSNSLIGVIEGIMAFGALVGAMFAGICSKKLKIQNVWIWFMATSLMLIPIGVLMFLHATGLSAFVIIAIAAFIMVATSTVLNIELISYVQIVAPSHMVSKVMSLIMCLCMCASPIGQVIYGCLFEILKNQVGTLFGFATLVSVILACFCRKVVNTVEE